MEGQIKRIIPSGEFVTYIIWIKEDEVTGRTYSGRQFRNYSYWKELKVGDWVGGLRWQNKEKAIIDGDSPVYFLQELLF